MGRGVDMKWAYEVLLRLSKEYIDYSGPGEEGSQWTIRIWGDGMGHCYGGSTGRVYIYYLYIGQRERDHSGPVERGKLGKESKRGREDDIFVWTIIF